MNKTAKKFGLMGWVVLALVVVALASLGLSFSIANQPTGQTSATASVQCNKDYVKTISFVAKNANDKAQTVSGVTYKVWKVIDGSYVPKDDASGELEIAYMEKYLIVAQKANTTDIAEEFAVDDKCNAPADKVFYVNYVPTSIDVTIESSKIVGHNAADNRIPIPRESTRSAQFTFNGVSKTSGTMVVVFDVDKDIIDKVSSTVPVKTVPVGHPNLVANTNSYGFDVGMLEGSSDKSASFDFTTKKLATLGDYNVTFTMYIYQSGYTNTDTGDYVIGDVLEDNDNEILLPSINDMLYLEITA